MSLPRPRLPHVRAFVALALSLCLLLVAATLPAGAAYDPGRPTSDTGKGGGGDSGGGDPGDGDSGGTSRKVALGVATPDASIGDLDSFTSAVGKKPAIWVLWSQWGRAATREFPTAAADALKDRNIQPMIWWEPVSPSDPDDPTYSRHRNISAGDHDAYIRGWARDAKAHGGSVLVRFAQEANNNYFPWSVDEFDNSPTTFKNAWRHVVDIVREEGATNVRWVWSIAKKSCSGGCNPYTEFYPGDAYVDVMGFSAYNWGAHPGKSWKSMYDSYQKVVRKLREVSDKPIMAAETASNSEGGDKPRWIRDGYREVYAQLPDVEAIVYLNADLRDVGHPDWRLTTPADALGAYAEIADLTSFETRSPFRGRVTAKSRPRGDGDRTATKRTAGQKKATSRDATEARTPRVHRGDAVDPKSKDQTTRASKARVTKRSGKRKKQPEPVQVLDPFSR